MARMLVESMETAKLRHLAAQTFPELPSVNFVSFAGIMRMKKIPSRLRKKSKTARMTLYRKRKRPIMELQWR